MMTPKSGLLLALACVCGIAAVGSIFELSSGNPELGVNQTLAVLVVSIPAGVAAFIGAVKDARANQS
jgi:hypothetical protein